MVIIPMHVSRRPIHEVAGSVALPIVSAVGDVRGPINATPVML